MAINPMSRFQPQSIPRVTSLVGVQPPFGISHSGPSEIYIYTSEKYGVHERRESRHVDVCDARGLSWLFALVIGISTLLGGRLEVFILQYLVPDPRFRCQGWAVIIEECC